MEPALRLSRPRTCFWEVDLTKLNWDRPELKRIPQAPRRQRAVFFKAKHPGWCRNCHQDFRIGTPIRYNAENQIVHALGCPSK